jgi:hypothetical protein
MEQDELEAVEKAKIEKPTPKPRAKPEREPELPEPELPAIDLEAVLQFPNEVKRSYYWIIAGKTSRKLSNARLDSFLRKNWNTAEVQMKIKRFEYQVSVYYLPQ